MIEITCLLEHYSGTDPGDDNRAITLNLGDNTEVSEQKAAQLAADFPDGFDVAKPSRADDAAAKKAQAAAAKERENQEAADKAAADAAEKAAAAQAEQVAADEKAAADAANDTPPAPKRARKPAAPKK